MPTTVFYKGVCSTYVLNRRGIALELFSGVQYLWLVANTTTVVKLRRDWRDM